MNPLLYPLRRIQLSLQPQPQPQPQPLQILPHYHAIPRIQLSRIPHSSPNQHRHYSLNPKDKQPSPSKTPPLSNHNPPSHNHQQPKSLSPQKTHLKAHLHLLLFSLRNLLHKSQQSRDFKWEDLQALMGLLGFFLRLAGQSLWELKRKKRLFKTLVQAWGIWKGIWKRIRESKGR